MGMKNSNKYEGFGLLIIALVATFLGGKAIITQESGGFITGVATAEGSCYYGKDAIIIGVIILVIASVIFRWAYKKFL